MTRKGPDLFYDGHEQISLIVVGNPMDHCCNTLQAHACVNARFWKRRHPARFIPVEFHKDQIPELQVAVTVTTDPAIRSTTTDPLTLVYKYL